MSYSPKIDEFLKTTKLGQAVISKTGSLSPTISPTEHTVTAPAIKSPIVRHQLTPDKYVSKPKLDLVKPITDTIGTPPIVTGFNLVSDFWSLMLGTRADKLKTITKMTPVDFDTKTAWWNVAVLKEETGGEDWNTPYVANTDIESPELPDITGFFGNIGKYLLIAGGVIAGIYLLGKYIGKPKK